MVAEFYNEDNRILKVFSGTNTHRDLGVIVQIQLQTDETYKKGCDPHEFDIPIEDIPYLIEMLKTTYKEFKTIE